MRRLTPDDFRLGKVAGRSPWHIIYPDPRTGATRRVSTRTDDQTEARRELNRFVSLWEREVQEAPPSPPVADIIDHYVQAVPSADFKSRRLREFFGDMRPEDINKGTCVAYTAHRRAAGVVDDTINNELLGVLGPALRLAREDHLWMGEFPTIKAPPKRGYRHRYLTLDEARALLAACEDDHLRLFVHIALATAGRTRAILDLTWDRVGFGEHMIDLRNPDKPENKNKRDTIVHMTDELRAVLEEAIRAYPRDPEDNDPVIQYAGAPVLSVRRSFAAAVKRAGLGHFTPHDLRRTAATWMAQDGVPMAEISRYLGHSTVRTTEKHYAVFHPEYHTRASAALNRRTLRTGMDALEK